MQRKIDRLDKYIEYSRLNDNQVTKAAGLAIGVIGKSRKEGRDLSVRAIELILQAYPDLNTTWLLTGEGEMLKSEPKKEMYPTAFEETAKRLAKDFQAQYGQSEESKEVLEKFTEERIMERFTYARDILIGMYEKGQIYSAATVKEMLAERDARLMESLAEKDEKIERLQREIWRLEEKLRQQEK